MLAELLRAANTQSVPSMMESMPVLWHDEFRTPQARLPHNIFGRAFAADVISACHQRLVLPWLLLQSTVLQHEVCRTLLAIVEFVRARGTFPRDLNSLVERGYLKSLPRAPVSRFRS